MKYKIISIIALILSAIACFIAWLRVDVTITHESYVGFIASFMGACATIIVGAQIYNSIVTSKELKEVRKTQTLLSKKLKDTEEELQKAKNERAIAEKQMDSKIHLTTGIAFLHSQPFSSFRYFFYCLQISLELEDVYGISTSLSDIAYLLNILDENSNNINPFDYDKIELCNPDNLEKYKMFRLKKRIHWLL